MIGSSPSSSSSSSSASSSSAPSPDLAGLAGASQTGGTLSQIDLLEQSLKPGQRPWWRQAACLCCPPQPPCVNLEDLPAGWSTYPHTLKGYRVNLGFWGALLSIFSWDHNEFWMIWSDLGPLLIFIGIAIAHCSSPGFTSSHVLNQLLEGGLFAGVMLARTGSTTYHIFNCASLWTSQRLINVDLIAICCMAFCSPYYYLMAFGIKPENAATNTGAQVYCAILALLFIVPFSVFVVNIIHGPSRFRTSLHQPLLVTLAAWGNICAVKIMFDSSFSLLIRAHCFVGVAGFLVGYTTFYIGTVPEVWMSKGSGDGKFWNSHVIWHGLTAISQLSYMMVLVLYPPLR